MQYKTLVLELLRQRTELHDQLLLTRRLLPTVETCARVLMDSEALEMALNLLEDRLPYVTPPDEPEALSLDRAVAFVRNPSPRK